MLKRFRLGLLAVLATLTLVSAVPSAAQAWNGTYLACSTYNECTTQMNQLRQINMKVYILSTGTNGLVAAQIADYVKQWGDTIIYMNVADYHDWNHFAGVVDATKTKTTVWGYYIADEPPTSDASLVSSYASHVQSVSGKGTLTVHFGYNGDQWLAAAGPFLTGAQGIMMADDYPIGTGLAASSVFDTWARAYSYTAQHGKGTFAVGQNFAWSQFPTGPAPSGGFPSRTQFRIMKDCAQNVNNGSVIWWGYDTWKSWQQTNPNAFAARWANWGFGINDPYVSCG